VADPPAIEEARRRYEEALEVAAKHGGEVRFECGETTVSYRQVAPLPEQSEEEA